MGGNALKTIQVQRMNREEFIDVCSTVMHKLTKTFNIQTGDLKVLPFFKNKESFGDVDLLIANEVLLDKKTFNDKLKSDLGSPEVAPSADFHIHPFAFEHKGSFYQVDLMFHPRNELLQAERYYGYNDLHVLINQFAMPLENDKLNLSFNKKGLIKNIYFDEKKNNKLGEIVVESDFYKVLNYLGLNEQKHKNGFNDIEDVFKYVMSSPNFDINVLNEKILSPNNDTKKRLKRPNFIAFVDYANKNSNLREVNNKGTVEYFGKIFPGVLENENEILRQYNEIQDTKKLLDGNVVSELSGFSLNDKRLGMLCRDIRSKFNDDDILLTTWIKSHNEAERRQFVIACKDNIVKTHPNSIAKKKIKP